MTHQFTQRACLVLGMVLALALTAAPDATAHAGAPTVGSTAIQQTVSAMESLHSYEVKVDMTASGGSAGGYTAHGDLIAVRHGKTFDLDMTMRFAPRHGQSITAEYLSTGTRTCARMTGRTSWNCLAASSTPSPLLGYADFHTMLGGHPLHLSPIGRQTVQGTVCNGYHVTTAVTVAASHPGMTIRGTLWLNAATHWIVEYDWSAAALTATGTPATAAAKVVFSHYNDPALAIPAIPAA